MRIDKALSRIEAVKVLFDLMRREDCQVLMMGVLLGSMSEHDRRLVFGISDFILDDPEECFKDD